MKLIALISGGIDSPVASYLMSEKGADVVLLHMDNRPYADDRGFENVKLIAQQLRDYTGKEFPLYSAPHGASQAAIHEKCDWSYQCVMCKRVMQRTARDFGRSIGCEGIIMGDSLGQVASQTLKNIKSENYGLNFPVVRPLIGLDKLEIIDIAKKIGTFELSIRPAKGCTIAPSKPVTEANIVKIQTMESEKVSADSLAETAAAAVIRVS